MEDPSTTVPPTREDLLADPSLAGKLTASQLEAFIVLLNNDGPLSVPSAYRDKANLLRIVKVMLKRLQDDPNAYSRVRPRLWSLHGWTRHDPTVLEGSPLSADQMHLLVTVEMPKLTPNLLHTYCPEDLNVVWLRAEAVYLGFEVRCDKMSMTRGYTDVKDANGAVTRFSTVRVSYDTGKSQKTKEVYSGTVGFVLRQPGCPDGRIQFAPTTLCGCVNGSVEDTDPDVELMRSVCCSHALAVLMCLKKWQEGYNDTHGDKVAFTSHSEWLANVHTYREDASASAATHNHDAIFFDPAKVHLKKLVEDAVASGCLAELTAKQALSRPDQVDAVPDGSCSGDEEETVVLQRMRKLGSLTAVNPLLVGQYPRRTRPELIDAQANAPQWGSPEWRTYCRELFDKHNPDSLPRLCHGTRNPTRRDQQPATQPTQPQPEPPTQPRPCSTRPRMQQPAPTTTQSQPQPPSRLQNAPPPPGTPPSRRPLPPQLSPKSPHHSPQPPSGPPGPHGFSPRRRHGVFFSPAVDSSPEAIPRHTRKARAIRRL